MRSVLCLNQCVWLRWKLPLNMILRCDNKRWWHLLQQNMEFRDDCYYVVISIADSFFIYNDLPQLILFELGSCVFLLLFSHCIICTVLFQLGNKYIIHRRQTLDNVSLSSAKRLSISFTTLSVYNRFGQTDFFITFARFHT